MTDETDEKISHWLYHHGLSVAAFVTVLAGVLAGITTMFWVALGWAIGLFTGAAIIGLKPAHDEEDNCR